MTKETGRKNKYDSSDDFSILMGTRNVSRKRAEEEKRARAAEAKKAKVAEEKKSDVVEEGTKPVEKEEPVKEEYVQKEDFTTMSIPAILKRKGEIEMFLSSIEEAHMNSKFPEYTYERLRKKSQMELQKINREVRSRGYDAVRHDEEKVGKYIENVKDSINDARNAERKVITTEYKQEAHPDNHLLDEMSLKMDNLSKKLDGVSINITEKMGKPVADEDDNEIIESVNALRREINSIKSKLSGYVRKGDLEKIMLKPSFGLYDVPKKKTAPPEEPEDRRIVFIEDLSEHVGKDVVIKCKLGLFKKIINDDTKMYWYKIEDETGDGILTSYDEIKAGKATIKGSVKKTKTGSYYLLYKSLA